MYLVKTTDGEEHKFFHPNPDDIGWQVNDGCLNILARLKEPITQKNEKGEEQKIEFLPMSFFPIHAVRFFKTVPDPVMEKEPGIITPGHGLPSRFRPPGKSLR